METHINIIEGYHATSEINADNIIADGFIINKNRKNDWLGHGIYLFKYIKDAETWANKTHYCNPNPCIIKCYSEIEKEKFMDLDNPQILGSFNEYFKEALDKFSEKNMEFHFKDANEAMCWGLNIYKKDKKIDAIKYTFRNTRTAKAMGYINSSKGYEYNEVQICLSQDDVILNKEICYLGGV